jgi:hypothetical protein
MDFSGCVQADGARLQGMFFSGSIEGYGVEVEKDGSRFAGIFKNGQRHGHGIWRRACGDIYHGNFQVRGWGRAWAVAG